ncbi:MAG: DUF86 domain-containing protein [Deltaproteobacteria bacterium]|nr:DUF86 domain-containing protein [Deltaproteobacteria bacterium]
MSSSRKWKFRVRHILEAISGAQSYVAGQTLEAFRADAKTVDAVLTKLMVIGEAAALVPVEVQDRHDEVPWRKMKGLRNVIVHQYDRVDVGIVWNVIHGDLPPLVSLLENVLRVEPDE